MKSSHTISTRIMEARVQKTPCPYTVIENAISPEQLKLINRFWPEEAAFKPYSDGHDRTIGDPGRFGFYIMGHTANERAKCLDTEKQEFWRDFALNTIGPAILSLYALYFPAIACRFDDVSALDLETFALLVNTYKSLKVGVHTDPPHFLLTALIYLDEGYTGVGTSFYKPKSPAFTHPGQVFLNRDDFDLVYTAPYSAGTLVSFANTGQSLHGVEPAVIEGRMGRRTINFHLRLTKQGIVDLYGEDNLERFNYPVTLDNTVMSTLDRWQRPEVLASVQKPTEAQLKPVRNSFIFEPKFVVAA